MRNWHRNIVVVYIFQHRRYILFENVVVIHTCVYKEWKILTIVVQMCLLMCVINRLDLKRLK